MSRWLTRFTAAAFTTVGLAALSARPAMAQKVTYVRGVVVDTVGKPIAQASVVITGSRGADSGRVVVSATTDDRGRFFLAKVPARTPLIVTARKVGYGAASGKSISFTTDTTEIRFELSTVELNTVYITASMPAAYRIDSTEINKRSVTDALDVVMRYKPRMLGDGYKNCPQDTSHLTVDTRYYPKPPRSMLGYSTEPRFQLYINGILHMEQGAKDILARIPAKDILEMRYVDCWDRATPRLRNSLIVILKPGVRY